MIDLASHPTGVRGLKSALRYTQDPDTRVAPHWGAWIEITPIAATLRAI